MVADNRSRITAKEFLWKFDEARGWCRSTAQVEPNAIQLSDKSDARDDVSQPFLLCSTSCERCLLIYHVEYFVISFASAETTIGNKSTGCREWKPG